MAKPRSPNASTARVGSVLHATQSALYAAMIADPALSASKEGPDPALMMIHAITITPPMPPRLNALKPSLAVTGANPASVSIVGAHENTL